MVKIMSNLFTIIQLSQRRSVRVVQDWCCYFRVKQSFLLLTIGSCF